MSLRKFFGFNRLRIGSRNFKVQLLPKSAFEDGEEADIRFDIPAIRLRRDLTESEATMDLLHELVHGILEDRLYSPQMKLSDAIEERIADAVSRGILEILTNNPKFQQWLGRYRP